MTEPAHAVSSMAVPLQPIHPKLLHSEIILAQPPRETFLDRLHRRCQPVFNDLPSSNGKSLITSLQQRTWISVSREMTVLVRSCEKSYLPQIPPS